jgi:hypothetical protein
MAWSEAARAAAAEARRRKGKAPGGASRKQYAKVLRYTRSVDKGLSNTGRSMTYRNAHIREAAKRLIARGMSQAKAAKMSAKTGAAVFRGNRGK